MPTLRGEERNMTRGTPSTSPIKSTGSPAPLPMLTADDPDAYFRDLHAQRLLKTSESQEDKRNSKEVSHDDEDERNSSSVLEPINTKVHGKPTVISTSPKKISTSETKRVSDGRIGATGGSQGKHQNAGQAQYFGGGGLAAAASAYQGRTLYVYRNGDTFFTARKVVVAPRSTKTFDQFLQELTTVIAPRTGAVHRVYNLQTKKRIETLDELNSGSVLVATGTEPFKPGTAYPPLMRPHGGFTGLAPGFSTFAGPASAVPGAQYDHKSTMSPASARADATATSFSRYAYNEAGEYEKRKKTHGQQQPPGPPRSRRATEGQDSTQSPRTKVDLQQQQGVANNSERGLRLAVFRNGDALSPPHRMVITPRRCRNFFQFIEELTRAMQMPGGLVRRVWDVESGTEVRSMNDLRDAQNLVASARRHDSFRAVHYALVDFTSQVSEPKRLSSMAREPARIVTVYPNGDMLHTGVKVTVTALRFRTLRALLAHLDREVPLYTGRATQLLDMNGTRISSLGELKHHGSYVVAADLEVFRPVEYNADANLAPRASPMSHAYTAAHKTHIKSHKTEEKQDIEIEQAEEDLRSQNKKSKVKLHIASEAKETTSNSLLSPRSHHSPTSYSPAPISGTAAVPTGAVLLTGAPQNGVRESIDLSFRRTSDLGNNAHENRRQSKEHTEHEHYAAMNDEYDSGPDEVEGHDTDGQEEIEDHTGATESADEESRSRSPSNHQQQQQQHKTVLRQHK